MAQVCHGPSTLSKASSKESQGRINNAQRESRGCFSGKQPPAAAGLKSSGRPAWGENKVKREPGRNAPGEELGVQRE